MKRVLTTIVTLALVALAGSAFADGSREAEGAKAGAPGHEAMGMGGSGMMGPGHSPGPMMKGGMMGESMMGGDPPGERPLISLALQQRESLGLSDDQVKALKQARSAFEKEGIRRRADIEIAELELADLLGEPRVDLAKVEAKARQTAGLRADLRIARIETLEKGKATLSADQLKKLMSEAGTSGGPKAGRGAEEMRRVMNSERAPQAMASMMEMARRMGNGDTMLGMVRMMEMMGSMGNRMDPTMARPAPQGSHGH